MDEKRALRVAGWSGIAFSALSLIVIPMVVTPPPALGAPAEDFARWYGEHRTAFLIGNYLGIAAFVPGFVQLAVLAARFRAREGASPWLGTLVLGSGVFAYAVFACSLVVFQALPFLVGEKGGHALRALGTLGAVWFALDGLAALPFVLAVGWATLETKALPRWVATASWITAGLAVLMSLGGVFDQPTWLAGGGSATFAGFVGFFAWTAALGVVFLRLDREV